MTERIVIEIDDSQLISVLNNLNTVSVVAKSTFGGTVGGKGTELGSYLPAVNRELRVILGQLPGMTEAIRIYYRLKRLERGAALGGANLWLSIIATTIILLQEINQVRRQIERDKQAFERFVRKNRSLTKEEFKRDRVLQRYYLKGQP